MLNGVKHLNDEILRSAQNDKGFSDRLLVAFRLVMESNNPAVK
jgi:hypothetical protein